VGLFRRYAGALVGDVGDLGGRTGTTRTTTTRAATQRRTTRIERDRMECRRTKWKTKTCTTAAGQLGELRVQGQLERRNEVS
jgi:C-terminal processing protease CtpA/Prc